MSQNLICGRYLTTQDDDFVLKVDRDIRSYFSNCTRNSILLFPPVNSYYRFLIHKVCNSLVNELTDCELTTFSIGVGDNRRTVVCHSNQLLIYPTNSSLKSSEETEFNWLYVARNSVPKYTTNDDKHRENRSNTESSMGIENVDAIVSHQTIEEKDSTCYKIEKSLLSEDSIIIKKNSRTRRPERAFYVPRAKRSQTTPPSTSFSSSTSLKSHSKKSEKSKSIDESSSSTSTEETNDIDPSSTKSETNQFSDCTVITSIDKIHTQSSLSCDLFINNQNCSENNSIVSQDITKDQKNHNNFCTMSSQQTEKELIITDESSDSNKIDKDEKELMKAQQEINRSNRKLIKQTFNSNVLEIESASGSNEKNAQKAVNKDDDDWDSLFDDNGDCLDPKMVEEITKQVGKVQIEKPKSDYKAYHSNVDLLRDEEYPHVLECSNFPVEFRTQDLMNLFAPYTRESGFNIIWVDDTHCLVVFSSSKIAAEVLTASHPIVKVKPLNEATSESRTKARKCSSSLQPYRQRPETCAALAKRLVSGALGVRIKATSEERENERRVLREAKERKLLAAKAREEMWNN